MGDPFRTSAAIREDIDAGMRQMREAAEQINAALAREAELRMTRWVDREITSIERLNCSTYGNPRFKIGLDGETCITSSDAAFCYEVENPGYRVGSNVRVLFTRAGRIANMETKEFG